MKLANITLAPTIRKYNKENLVHDVITGLIIMAVSMRPFQVLCKR